MIPLVMGGNGHDGTRAIAGEDIVGDPDGDLFPIDRIDCRDTNGHARFRFG